MRSRVALLPLLCLVFTGCAATVPCGLGERCWVPDLRCTITAPPVVRLGDPIPVRFKLTNTWPTVHVLQAGTPLQGFRDQTLTVLRDGQNVFYRGFLLEPTRGLSGCEQKGCFIREVDYLEIDSHESISVVEDLNEGYRIDRPGMYEIGYDGFFYHVGKGPIPPYDTDPKLGKKRPFRRAKVFCQVAVVQVLPKLDAPAAGGAK